MKQTKARTAIVHFLQKEHVPVDVHQITQHLKNKQMSIDVATVYRNLERFYKEGIIDRLEFQEGKFRYEIKHKDDHHHLICQECGKVEDISDCSIPQLVAEIQKKKQFIVKRHSLEFFGLCKNCQK